MAQLATAVMAAAALATFMLRPPPAAIGFVGDGLRTRLNPPVIRSGPGAPKASVAEEPNRRADGLGPS